ncbi:MAG: phosphatase PAP2 family protein [Coriobacteriia bacterium]|nr:phosphatase PAP2 family protein [Coriobacteriia bacterium]
MNAQQYNAISQPLRQRPALLRALTVANIALTCLGYVMYPLLVAVLFATHDAFLLRCIVVPAVSFVLVSVLRAAVNQPRPYEALDIVPLIAKDTQGKSFPSRHAFSIIMIALCWLYWLVPVGVFMLVAGVILSVVRVLVGVHYPHDVVAGALIGAACGVVGFWVIP